jgi:hypothetical protein
MLAAALLLAGAAALPDGVYSNEEQVYFEKDAGRAPPPWLSVRVESGKAVAVDAFGKPTSGALPAKLEASQAGLTATTTDGVKLDLRRGRPFACWASLLKSAKKPDGSEAWSFSRLKLHDAGGRATVSTDEAMPKSATIRMRNVVWPSGPNRPSLVLYVHRDDPDRAESYAWADPGAKRIGVNLRWVQASCTLEGSGA